MSVHSGKVRILGTFFMRQYHNMSSETDKKSLPLMGAGEVEVKESSPKTKN